jgi:hypothetical protein
MCGFNRSRRWPVSGSAGFAKAALGDARSRGAEMTLARSAL